MSVIELTREHNLDMDHAVQAADELAQSLSERFSVDYEWEDKVLRFHRTGVKGQLEVAESQIHLHMELGFLFRPFKDRIEQEIHSHLDGLLKKA
ncbi:conserved hypothetical protein [Hahella chejuensis KCTC 2396]|uniref:Polyhydroxyalkanoic acid system protein n=1 Tax=Hahella chejuensis (strain KCTC 2396) TaxID=349521 RepID=Q2SN11_HAHCH|nr:polyhydroxyalkanoic acid system family protein [Hahella chejuensis]ABC27963.1 conserved hypothetical protein [Hahella chejuensis KCTC 2396]